MIKTNVPARSLQIFFSLNALALFAAGMAMFLIARGVPLSALRTLVISGSFFLGAVCAGLAVIAQIRPARLEAAHSAILGSVIARRLTLIIGILFAACWGLTWFPVEATARLYSLFIGIYPLVLVGTLSSGMSLVLLMSAGGHSSRKAWNDYWHGNKEVFRVGLVGLIGLGLVAFLAVQFGVFKSAEPYWYGAGVPLLASQVYGAVIIGILVLALETKLFHTRSRMDLALFLLVWMVAAFFWSRQPLNQGFLITPPLPPNYESYPFSDLVTFDLGSQFALIGQGINNHLFFDRALYMSFLTYLHSVGGQNYEHLMAIQAAIFSVFAALLYLVGKRLHSWFAGILLATLTIFRGSNSLIATSWIQTSTFKHMMTDFPTAIGLAVFTVLVLRWLEDPQHRWQEAGWAAGTLGLTSLLRLNVLLLFPALLLLAFWVSRRRWKSSLALVGFALLAFLASVSPWVIFGPAHGSIVTLYRARIEDVIRKRYLPGTFIPARTSVVPAVASNIEVLLPSLPQTGAPSRLAAPFPITYFLNNLVTSALIFPDSPQFLTVTATVKGGEGFWKVFWDGRMSSVARTMLIFNLIILLFGIGVAYKRCRWRGLIPLAVFLIYHIANALARTSGGRYLVPVDWVLVAYFGLGLAEILLIGRLLFVTRASDLSFSVLPISPANEGVRRVWLPRASGVLLSLAMIGATVPLAGNLFPLRYVDKKPSNIVDEMAPFLPALGLRRVDVESFLLQPQAFISEGRVLYPRYYRQGKGEPNPMPPYANFAYPRLVFLFIGPHGLDYAILPGEPPKVFPNASDAILLGCKYTVGTFSAASALVVVLPEQAVSYARSPMAPLACPLPEPVCNNNKICH
jgi:hypothetical protein